MVLVCGDRLPSIPDYSSARASIGVRFFALCARTPQHLCSSSVIYIKNERNIFREEILKETLSIGTFLIVIKRITATEENFVDYTDTQVYVQSHKPIRNLFRIFYLL